VATVQPNGSIHTLTLALLFILFHRYVGARDDAAAPCPAPMMKIGERLGSSPPGFTVIQSLALGLNVVSNQEQEDAPR